LVDIGYGKIWWGLVPTSLKVPKALKDTLKYLAHGRGVVTSSQSSTFNRVKFGDMILELIDFLISSFFRIANIFFSFIVIELGNNQPWSEANGFWYINFRIWWYSLFKKS
jgi:hypothetical protein